jgi:hypothetical protein
VSVLASKPVPATLTPADNRVTARAMIQTQTQTQARVSSKVQSSVQAQVRDQAQVSTSTHERTATAGH